MKLISSHFKAKSFGSFVRQLNMYNFYKVKGQKHRNEFRHPFFKRDSLDNLKYIRRKHVKKSQANNMGVNLVDDSLKRSGLSSQFMESKLAKMQEILKLMNKQNHDLMHINDRMLDELGNVEQILSSKLKQFLELVANIVITPQSPLVQQCEQLLINWKQRYPDLDGYLRQKPPLIVQSSQELENPNHLICLSIIDEINAVYQHFRNEMSININKRSQSQNNISDSLYVLRNSYSPSPSYDSSSFNQLSNHENHIKLPFDISPLGLNHFLPSPRGPSFTQYALKTLEDMKFELFINEACGDINSADESINSERKWQPSKFI